MSEIKKEEFKDIVSKNDYEEGNPIYQKIRKEFTNKLKEKYTCNDYDTIVNYVFDCAFKKKTEKSKCIENMNNLFNNNASGMIDYLWKITKDIETKDNNQDDNNRFSSYKRGGKPYSEKYNNRGRYTFDNRQKYHKNKPRDNSGERSRSYSSDRNDNEKYQNYPMKQRGFYPPKGRFASPMMPMGGGYPPYYPPQMMQPFKR